MHIFSIPLMILVGVIMLWIFVKGRSKPHQADEYFKNKFLEPMSNESHAILCTAYFSRHQHPDLTGPELVRLAYWGVVGEK